MSSSGPETSSIRSYHSSAADIKAQIVDINQAVVDNLKKQGKKIRFSEVFGNPTSMAYTLGKGDFIEVSIWEALPATLFSPVLGASSNIGGANRVVLPEQMVDENGEIQIPFVGKIQIAKKTITEIEANIVRKLKGKANQPQVMIRVAKNTSSNITVVSDSGTTLKMPLTSNGEKVLDAIAAVGGTKQSASKTAIQLTRNDDAVILPLETIINEKSQNIKLSAGDIIVVLHQPKSFTSLGATNKNEEIYFETQGISLAQALARVGGLNDNRADAKGVFIFRYESSKNTNSAESSEKPIIYRLDLKDPASFFYVQNFTVENKDVIYVSNAPIAETQKFMNLLLSAYPLLSITNAMK